MCAFVGGDVTVVGHMNQTSGKKLFVFSEIQPRESRAKAVYLFSQLRVCMLICKHTLDNINTQTRTLMPLPAYTFF